MGDVEGEFWGSWAPPDDSDDDDDADGGLTEEQAKEIEEKEEARKKRKIEQDQAIAEQAKASALAQERSVFHGKELTDYQGRTYIWPPTDAKPREHDCFIPKKLIHTWSGHTKGVNCVKFFPKYGHLLISASMDQTIKIWDTAKDKKCLRTIYGHTGAVRDITLSEDGTNMLSCGYDKVIRHWDVETGQCKGRFNNGSMTYQARMYPKDENLFLAASQDKRIYQWDIRANSIVQEYNEHLGPINTVTFIDNNRRFVSTSDDKKIFVWEFGIPVVIKHVSDPTMHAVPAVAMHPTGAFMACQSLDNTISIYQSDDRFRLKPQKKFKGHVCAGYACQLTFSPDGRFLASGDGNGRAFFWDFKSSKCYRTLKAHEGVCITLDWHPIEPSRVATAGWDGTIKYWD